MGTYYPDYGDRNFSKKILDVVITEYEGGEPLTRVSVSLFLSTLVIPCLYIYICIYICLYIDSWLLAFR